MTDINTNGTSLRGHFQMPYAKLVGLIGEPNAASDGYKTDVEWAFERDGVVATIYNWKNGPNYIGRGTIEDIDEWNVGGHSSDAMDVVSALMYEDFSRMWFALCADGTLSVLGDHGDYEAADATAEDLGLDVVWLVCGDDAAQWANTINSKLIR